MHCYLPNSIPLYFAQPYECPFCLEKHEERLTLVAARRDSSRKSELYSEVFNVRLILPHCHSSDLCYSFDLLSLSLCHFPKNPTKQFAIKEREADPGMAWLLALRLLPLLYISST